MPANGAMLLSTSRSAQFRKRLLSIMGDCRLLWMPSPGDTTPVRSFETWPGRAGTPGASVASQLSQLGRGQQQSFASASSQFISFPDAASLSFGSGTADSAMSGVVLANVTDTAAAREFFSKWNGAATTREYQFAVTTGDLLIFNAFDESATTSVSRTSDAAITQGSWHLFGFSYDGSGGAIAMNGVTLYQDGAVIASTAANNAAYVSMEDTAAAFEIGSVNAHAASFMDGSIGLVAVGQKNMSTSDHLGVVSLCRRYFGVPL